MKKKTIVLITKQPRFGLCKKRLSKYNNQSEILRITNRSRMCAELYSVKLVHENLHDINNSFIVIFLISSLTVHICSE